MSSPMDDQIEEARKWAATFAERHGLDAVQILWSRTFGDETSACYTGIGNDYARRGMTMRYLDVVRRHDQKEVDEEYKGGNDE